MTARPLRAAVFAGTWLAAAGAMADEPAAGQALYNKHCLTCHQADGGGVPNMQPAIAGGSWVKGDARALALFVMSGGFDSASRKDSDVGNVMPPFRQLADADIAAILTYIRQKFGEGSSPVSAAEITAARRSDHDSTQKPPEPGKRD
jgi:mono/diheme cytochrome c family protein